MADYWGFWHLAPFSVDTPISFKHSGMRLAFSRILPSKSEGRVPTKNGEKPWIEERFLSFAVDKSVFNGKITTYKVVYLMLGDEMKARPWVTSRRVLSVSTTFAVVYKTTG